MINVFDDLPIIACSTGLSENTAIGLIRISGFSSFDILNPFFNYDLSLLKANYVKHCKIIFENIFYDDVVITFFKGPKSYNGENILEISVHGNTINIKRIIELFISNSIIRQAHNGEFTYRALINGKLTLSQVEGLDALLNATSSSMLDQGLDLLHGSLYQRYLELASEFKKLRSNIELNIDFLEDIGEEQGNKLLNESILNMRNLLKDLNHSASVKKESFLSPDVVFFGKPNAGKSSLFNELLHADRAIVSTQEGTTRDYISESISINGRTFNLVDTAGIRETENIVEMSGISKAQTLVKEAFIRFHLIDIRDDIPAELSKEEADVVIFTHIDCSEYNLNNESLVFLKNKLLIFASLVDNKICTKLFGPKELFVNLFGPIEPDSQFYGGPIEPLIKSGPIEAKTFTGPIEPFFIKDIFQTIEYIIMSKFSHLNSFDPILIDRQRDLISDIHISFEEFYQIYKHEKDIAILSSEVNSIDSKISRLIGITTPDEVLNNIFSNFCIGK